MATKKKATKKKATKKRAAPLGRTAVPAAHQTYRTGYQLPVATVHERPKQAPAEPTFFSCGSVPPEPTNVTTTHDRPVANLMPGYSTLADADGREALVDHYGDGSVEITIRGNGVRVSYERLVKLLRASRASRPRKRGGKL